MADVVVVGGCNMDLIAHTQRLPRPGETVLGDQFLTAPGGKGSNQAVAAARLGAAVSLVARVGADDFGSRLRQMLRDEGVDVRHVLVDAEAPSGVALITVDERGTRAAAATGIAMPVSAVVQPVTVVRADHPFVFLIRDTRTNSLLFLGRVQNPQA